MATTRNKPTPTPTVAIRSKLSMDCTWSAKTFRSGSDTVMIKPIRKQTAIINQSRLVFVMCAPTCSPIGVIAMSAPSVKMPMPTIRQMAPTMNITNTSVGIGATVKHRIATIAVIGMTDFRDSFTFSCIFEYKGCAHSFMYLR